MAFDPDSPLSGEQMRQIRRKLRYVVMYLLPDGKIPTADRITVPTHSHFTCAHAYTVCAVCGPAWELDYDVRWNETPYGRSLKAMIDSGRYL